MGGGKNIVEVNTEGPILQGFLKRTIKCTAKSSQRYFLERISMLSY